MAADDRHVMLVVAGALFDGGGSVLVQRRPAGRHHGGRWEFPGGKVDPDETPPDALARELAEELGIEVAPADASPLGFALATSAAGRPIVLLLFRVGRWRGDPAPLDAQTLAWVSRAELVRLDLAPTDRELAALIG